MTTAHRIDGLDARIELRPDGSIYFASKGCSRSSRGLTRRNPDRRAAIEHVLSVVWKSCPRGRKFEVVVTGGKGGAVHERCNTCEQVIAAVRLCGNYRVDLCVLGAELSADDLGLVVA